MHACSQSHANGVHRRWDARQYRIHVRIAFISYIHDRRSCAHASAKSDFPSRSRLFSGASIRTCFRCRPEWFMNQPFWTGVRRDFAKTCVCGSWMKPRKPRPESKRAVSCIQYDWWFASEAYDSAIIGVSRKKNATIVHNDGIGMVAGVACPHLWTLNTIVETGDN